MSEPSPTTTVLRRELRSRRAALTPSLRISAAQQVAARLLALGGLPTEGFAAGYWAVDSEIALHAWQVALPAGLVYCLPVLHGDGRLRFAPWRAGDPLVANRFGIPEPAVESSSWLQAGDLAVAITPLVGFDPCCNRLGMGGGWYDRTFAARTEAQFRLPMLIGAAYEVQRVERITANPWDVPLDAVCTEAATYLRSESTDQ